jgi:flagellar hook protein FlgE
MSIYGAMFSGVSGLNANSQSLGMIADNISNVNTVGYKGNSAQFSTLVTQSPTRTTFSPGGVMSQPAPSIDQQGLLQGTGSKTDVAMAGNGFFVVNEASSPGLGDEYFFTRAGAFNPDENGDLVNTAGYFLQGWPLTNGVTLPTNTSVLTSVQTVNISNLNGAARATANLELQINLPSTAAVADTHSATVQIFDSLGNSHDLQIDFTKTATNAWDITVQDPVLSSTGVASGTVTAAVRNITFAGDGTPATITFPDIDITGWTTGASNSTIAVDAGTVGVGDGLTQYAGEFSLDAFDQDGIPFGRFTSVSIDTEGIVTALFDNGEKQAIYKLPVAMFANPNGLEAVNGNAYRQSGTSGDLLLKDANVGGAGAVASSALEASNVDLADEFTKMITTQRAYSANAKIITTADEMLDELIRIRR